MRSQVPGVCRNNGAGLRCRTSVCGSLLDAPRQSLQVGVWGNCPYIDRYLESLGAAREVQFLDCEGPSAEA